MEIVQWIQSVGRELWLESDVFSAVVIKLTEHRDSRIQHSALPLSFVDRNTSKVWKGAACLSIPISLRQTNERPGQKENRFCVRTTPNNRIISAWCWRSSAILQPNSETTQTNDQQFKLGCIFIFESVTQGREMLRQCRLPRLLILLSVLVSIEVTRVQGHGRLVEPPSRSSAWR